MAKNGKRITFLHTYRFRATEKDPIIDTVFTLLKDAEMSVQDAHRVSGVSATTLYNWQDGPTRRPQWATVSAVIRSTGHEVVLNKVERPQVGSKSILAQGPRTVSDIYKR